MGASRQGSARVGRVCTRPNTLLIPYNVKHWFLVASHLYHPYTLLPACRNTSERTQTHWVFIREALSHTSDIGARFDDVLGRVGCGSEARVPAGTPPAVMWLVHTVPNLEGIGKFTLCSNISAPSTVS